MAAPYTPRINVSGVEYFPEPYSAPELSPTLRIGLIPIGLLATLSVVSSSILIGFILHRFVTWQSHYKTFVGYNQYVVLVLNLLIADLQQSAAFLVSWHWYRKHQILAPSAACFAQGWLLHSGDVGSGFFVLAIAVHTYYTAVTDRRVGRKMFAAIILGIWILTYFLTVIGVGIHGQRYFVRAGAWCWVSSAFETSRLWCHYIWVFINQFGTIVIYLLTFYALRKKTRQLFVDGKIPPNSPNAATIKAVNRVTMLMTLYPCVYVLLTLPLSTGRMWSMNHGGKPTSEVFSCIAGSLLTSCGWVDSLLYTLTRKRLLRDTMPNQSSRRTGDHWESHELGSKGITHTRTVTVEAGMVVDFDMVEGPTRKGKRFSTLGCERLPSPTGSIDPILSGRGLPGTVIGQVKTEISAGQREIDGHRRFELDGSSSSHSTDSMTNRKMNDGL